MERQLNKDLLDRTMGAKGHNQTTIAEALGITRAAVSKWLTGKSFPRPAELLKLGKLLGLAYSELVLPVQNESSQPLVAFRKRASTKTTAQHVAHAQEMGRLLEPVVPHLPFDQFLSPSRLKSPSLDYEYVQSLVAEMRRDLKLDQVGKIDFPDLIGKFKQLQAVIIPVMWGLKQRHENALHIYLPKSKTTWIYLNLDSNLHDFKFWMAHELGHVLAVNLLESGEMNTSEDFSDAFAGALLLPEPAAKVIYAKYIAAPNARARIAIILEAARTHVISPNSVYLEVEKYANHAGVEFPVLSPQELFSAISRFNKGYPSVSEILFDGKKPSADHFMRVTAENFKTPIFAALGNYFKASPQSEGLLSRILDVPLADAKALRQALE